jgi:ABC-type phosphate/phosphonate transport system substrate-binding protein
LIPKGKAVSATEQNIAKFEARKAELEQAAAETLEAAKARAEAVSKISVIIAKKGSNIMKSSDLKGKSVLAFKFKKSAAAYVFQVKHLLDQGIDPYKDFGSFTEAKSQDDIVLAVKNGLVDAGFIKTGLLEAMEKEGKIKKSDFEIVDQVNDGFAHVHSTKLYPEWTMTSSPKADPAMSGKIKTALLKLNNGNEACKKARIAGFVEPLSFDELDNTMQTLKLGPYKE